MRKLHLTETECARHVNQRVCPTRPRLPTRAHIRDSGSDGGGDTPRLSNRKFFSLSCRSSWNCDMGWEVRGTSCPGPGVLFSSRSWAGPWRAAIFLLTYKVIYSPSQSLILHRVRWAKHSSYYLLYTPHLNKKSSKSWAVHCTNKRLSCDALNSKVSKLSYVVQRAARFFPFA